VEVSPAYPRYAHLNDDLARPGLGVGKVNELDLALTGEQHCLHRQSSPSPPAGRPNAPSGSRALDPCHVAIDRCICQVTNTSAARASRFLIASARRSCSSLIARSLSAETKVSREEARLRISLCPVLHRGTIALMSR